MTQRLEVADVNAPAAADLRRDCHVREHLQAPVDRIPCADLAAELQVGLGDPGVVPHHLHGLGHGTEPHDHLLAQLTGKLRLRNAYRHGVLHHLHVPVST